MKKFGEKVVSNKNFKIRFLSNYMRFKIKPELNEQ
jgi:hypothetical protein